MHNQPCYFQEGVFAGAAQGSGRLSERERQAGDGRASVAWFAAADSEEAHEVGSPWRCQGRAIVLRIEPVGAAGSLAPCGLLSLSFRRPGGMATDRHDQARTLSPSKTVEKPCG